MRPCFFYFVLCILNQQNTKSNKNTKTMKKKFTFLMAVCIMLLTMMVLPGRVVGQTRTTTTYQHVFNVKPSTGNNVTLSSVNWNITATNLGNYNSNNYAGVQLGTSSKNGSITLTSSNSWGGQSGTYSGKTKITEVRLWLNLGGTSVTPSVCIGGVDAVSDGTTVVKNSSAGSDWTKTTKVTFTPASSGESGVVVINVETLKAGYICCVEIDCEEPSAPTVSIPTTPIEVISTGDIGNLDITYNNMTISDVAQFDVVFYDEDGTTPLTGGAIPTWVGQSFSGNDTDGYTFNYNISNYTGATNQVARLKVYALDDDYTTEAYSDLLVITQKAYVAPTEFAMYSESLVEGDYIIYYDGYAMKNEVDGGRLSYETVTPTSNVITTDNNTIIWHITQSGDYWTIYNADANAYAASTGAKNKAQMLADGTDDKAMWTVSVSRTATYEFVNKANSASGVNANLRNNGTYGFACYATTTGGALSLYKKVETFTLDIAQYTDQFEGWYLIASPVTVTLENNPMVPNNNYDLYRFNPAAENEWENYRANDNNEPLHPDFTTLEVGRGYLYANGNDGGIQLSFTGVPTSNGEVTVPNAGWNLVGNPLNTAATITNSYYRINENHTGIMAGTGNIAVMEGIFVYTTAANQKVVFSIPEPGKSRNSNALVINLNRNDNVIDRAIVRFGESEKLSKFQLFEGDTKIYIPQNGKDYAIAAMDDNTQAFSLNFHAKTTGKYTLSLGETSNLSYVHLFDRMTGEDVDMLLEDSYSFIGSPADSEERFIVRLSYNASSTDSETFAYQSGNGIIVNGEGELQIFDVTGRKVMTTTINGVQTVNGLNNGLYIFKLNEKTQKIVVR